MGPDFVRARKTDFQPKWAEIHLRFWYFAERSLLRQFGSEGFNASLSDRVVFDGMIVTYRRRFADTAAAASVIIIRSHASSAGIGCC